MKKGNILNSEISCVISKMGHTDFIVLADCGLPIPDEVLRIDLALELGKPSFLEVLKVVLSELYVEKFLFAEEIKTHNKNTYDEAISILKYSNFTEEEYEECNKILGEDLHPDKIKMLEQISHLELNYDEFEKFKSFIRTLSSDENYVNAFINEISISDTDPKIINLVKGKVFHWINEKWRLNIDNLKVFNEVLAPIDSLDKFKLFKKFPKEQHSVSHEVFKKECKGAKAIIRTGEDTPYSNVILYSGVIF